MHVDIQCLFANYTLHLNACKQQNYLLGLQYVAQTTTSNATYDADPCKN